MAIRIFDLTESKQIIITEHAMCIPEVQEVVKKFPKEHFNILKFCYFMTVPDSPYDNFDEEEKEEIVLKDVGGSFSLDDKVVQACLTKFTEMYISVVGNLYLDSKRSLISVSKMLGSFKVTAETDPKLLAEVRQYQQNIMKIYEQFERLEKKRNEEFKVSLRGKKRLGRY